MIYSKILLKIIIFKVILPKNGTWTIPSIVSNFSRVNISNFIV